MPFLSIPVPSATLSIGLSNPVKLLINFICKEIKEFIKESLAALSLSSHKKQDIG
jgi:hypothetical protein